MEVDSGFFKRRWMDFRNGHSIYLAFIMSFANFILITYNFAIKETFLSGIFNNILAFILAFTVIYIPTAIVFGYWHRRNQYSVEVEAMNRENWQNAWISLVIMKMIEGTATLEEKEKVRVFFEGILKRQNKDHLIPEYKQVKDIEGHQFSP